jgi:hypothetical protein
VSGRRFGPYDSGEATRPAEKIWRQEAEMIGGIRTLDGVARMRDDDGTVRLRILRAGGAPVDLVGLGPEEADERVRDLWADEELLRVFRDGLA